MTAHNPTETEWISAALAKIDEMRSQQTDGVWLERLTVENAPLISEWDIEKCWIWKEWSDRPPYYPQTDIGIDVVGRRKDGKLIAIQCKSRRLDNEGQGHSVTKKELDTFLSASSAPLWEERWLVVGDGDISLAPHALAAAATKPVKRVNIKADLLKQRDAAPTKDEPCPCCQDPGERQTRDCMQREAVRISVDVLKKHAEVSGHARGRIILPCGTGKSRIALRIIEELTQPGEVSVLLCPSIALVAQLRREFLLHRRREFRPLAVCSDSTVTSSDLSKDQTADVSHASASEVKGQVTTDPSVIGKWIDNIRNSGGGGGFGVIFGTYQSGHRIAEALAGSGKQISVMIADEAHRTAGLRRIAKGEEEQKLRDFTVCHNDEKFPAKFRIYQTATPRVYDTGGKSLKNDDWIVRNMDDEEVFGVELYRKSYADAVANEWLTDYRIIALGVNDEDAYKTANDLASKSSKALSTAHFLRGLALALVMAGALRRSHSALAIRSSINFMNTIRKSDEMTKALQTQLVRNWVQRKLNVDAGDKVAAAYTLEHLDANSNVAKREHAKARLAEATESNPHGIINVGIFGEGTDAPSLSAVGFIEARRSPVDVIQAVGRVMRRSPGKEMGYIICPILIPPDVDAESWLRTSGPEDGWKELGQILLALRAHDSRIEDNLADLLQLYLPPKNEKNVATMVAIGKDYRITYYGHIGKSGIAESDVETVLSGKAKPKDKFCKLNKVIPELVSSESNKFSQPVEAIAQRIVSGSRNLDGNIEIREEAIPHDKGKADGTLGPINIRKSKKISKDMVNGKSGRKIHHKKSRKTKKEKDEDRTRGLFDQLNIDEVGIDVNLLVKSGLSRNRSERDVNILLDSICEATRYLAQDELGPVLDRHFDLNQLKAERRAAQADGCTIASLLLMNAAMLHQRIAAGQWLAGISGLDAIKNEPNTSRKLEREWNNIAYHDFLPVIKPAIEVIRMIEDTGKIEGLNRSLRHTTAEAERIAETYAELGSDHAGALFNKVMGNQASDGAYFTRPVAASMVARLTLDTCGFVDWSDSSVWRRHTTVDLACGSGTLLAAMMTEMKRRAKERKASQGDLARLQKIAVEETIRGFDINPISLQMAASQLTAGNQDIRYRRMRLFKMPYGSRSSNRNRGDESFVGSLELLGSTKIVPNKSDLDLPDEQIRTESIMPKDTSFDSSELEDAVDAASGVQIVIMNPPFTNRAKIGEKFSINIQNQMRKKTDFLEAKLTRNDPIFRGFWDKNSIQPLFVELADKCLNKENGILAMINPTVALTAVSALQARKTLAQRFHIHTLLTCHLPGQINLSQNTAINESIVIARRHEGTKPPTRIINLDKMPIDEAEVEEFHRCLLSLLKCAETLIPEGWGEVSEWPENLIENGDWTAAIWRSTKLAMAAADVANNLQLPRLSDLNILPAATGQLLRSGYQESSCEIPESFPILKSKGADAQTRIQSRPDQYWAPKPKKTKVSNEVTSVSSTKMILDKAGYLLITAGQRNDSARLTAVAGDKSYVGNGWFPVAGITPKQAKSVAVFLNSTLGRIQLMRNPGRTLEFPNYSVEEVKNVRIPDIQNEQVCTILAECFQCTANMDVPQFRDGESKVRQLWDEAVAEAIGRDEIELAELRNLLHREPHVRGLGYNEHQ